MTCKDWLRQNGYEDVADLIDRAMFRMAVRGSRQRRNWWNVLAGGPNGEGYVREGIRFPVLQAAQSRQGRPITPDALCRNDREEPPAPRSTGRWAARQAAGRQPRSIGVRRAGRVGERKR